MTGLLYHAPTDRFVADPQSLKHAADDIRHAMRLARELGGKPLEPHKRKGVMTASDHLERTLIDLASSMGIDLGCTWPGQLDLREKP